MDAVPGHGNIYAVDSGMFGVLPVIVESTRTVPYVQYGMLKNINPDASVSFNGSYVSASAAYTTHSSGGIQIPSTYAPELTNPVFSVAFMIIEIPGNEGTVSLTSEDLALILSPSVKPFNSQSPIDLTWQSDDPRYSAWGEGSGVPTVFTKGQQYIVTTSPQVGNDQWFNDMPPGYSVFSLDNGLGNNTTYDGMLIGILGVTCRFNFIKDVT